MEKPKTPQNHRTRFMELIGVRERRKIRARRQQDQNIWFGLGLLGLVGWSIVVPTLLGLALGAWIDRQFPSQFSWTLMLMVGGLLLGCFNAWNWVAREQAAIDSSQEDQPSDPALSDPQARQQEERQDG